jgi:CRP-like cAMP-binding protein
MSFAADLAELLGRSDLTEEELAADLRAAADALEQSGTPARCQIVPFLPGRRPTDEAEHPGLGSSDSAMVVLDEPGRANTTMVLFDLEHVPDDAVVEVDVTLASPDPASPPTVLPGWNATRLDVGGSDGPDGRHRIDLHPDTDLVGQDLGFGVGLLGRARVAVRVLREGRSIAADEAFLDVCDIRLLGRLYERVIERVVTPDTAAQAAAAGVADPGPVYHPWFPVLHIGGDKAALYTRALVEDIVDKGANLTDPAWLLRVGVYLELLTCIGIAEAVRDDVGDLLDPAERLAVETSPIYEEIRNRIDPDAWRRVWRLRTISFPRRGTPRTGPVSAANLLAKRKATMAFLHVHHDDLKHAIELAGANRRNSQETWQRVFRDAERAVLRQTSSSFPELDHLPEPMREIVLWQRRSFADQQGLYATACVQYRASMNSVAEWAKALGYMDHTGAECIPTSSSLLHAYTREPDRVALLQRYDGYGPTLELAELEPTDVASAADIAELLSSVPIFHLMSKDETAELAVTARPILLGPTERLVRHGEEGTSLFVVADGEVEVLLRLVDGSDVSIETMGAGAIVGEMGLLTGEARAATVRGGADGALVYEIAEEGYKPLLQAHPEWLDVLALEMEARLVRSRAILAGNGDGISIRERIRRRFFIAGVAT